VAARLSFRLTHAGLHREDLIMEELPGVKEALRRLPEEVVSARYFRIKRVSLLTLWLWLGGLAGLHQDGMFFERVFGGSSLLER
jgi:hypothetical protein